jgi:predicted transcriptional regulator
MNEGEISLENQRLIYYFILKNPGMHLRGISRGLQMQLGTLRYHIDQLEKRGMIVGKDDGNLRTFFITNKLSPKDQQMASLLQQKRFRDIIIVIIKSPGLTQTDMIEQLGLRPPTISKYAMVLERRGVIFHVKEENGQRYYVTDEDWVMRLIIAYRESFWDKFVDNALEIYFD